MLSPLVLIAMVMPTVSASAGLLIGGGVGAVLHEQVYSDLSSSGSMKTVFLEYGSELRVGARLEIAWLEFPANSPDIPKSQPTSYGTFQSSDNSSDNPAMQLAGGGVRLMWFHAESGWIQPYGSFSVGGYKIDQDEYKQIMILLGPGFGVRLGRGRPSIGFELDMQMAVFEEDTKFLVPIKAYASVRI